MARGAVNGDVVLRVSDLRISFSTYAGEVQAVRGASFDLRQGETLAIVGESGSGKSVAAKSIMRLNPESNTIVREERSSSRVRTFSSSPRNACSTLGGRR